MARYSPSIQNLIAQLSNLPGIGGKSAQRIAFHILAMDDQTAGDLTDSIATARRNTKRCSCCQNFTDSDPCPVCSDPMRDRTTVLVVETPRDVSTFERMHEYSGLYHVLHGVFDPMKSKSIQDTTISQLLRRLSEHSEITEVIIATNQNAEGNATALYLARILAPSGINVTRLASGLPMGSDIEFADDLTLASALKGRVQL
ncbi:MAG: recombination mediator RecR [Saccharofermentans sp.]|jgi:recombination protein RecR|nr:recombination mediator RecR [Mageeibacillus sp.]MCI1264433.1 recombination mediator RecR [Saccharofermentans sp.]MCI1275636.1 recombination mediator RecR [Saccharofermentans sp.]MCI1768800.1 recombination mediator RecR [Mageeibacillus sp.]